MTEKAAYKSGRKVHKLLLYLSTVGIIPKIQSKPLSHPIECAPVNTENLRGSDFVSLGFLQNADEVTFLNLLKRQTSLVA
jgi:hypothetical protein